MHVATILKDKGRDVETVRRGAKVMDVARKLSARRIGSIVVLDQDESIVGIISERDIVRVVGQHGVDALDWTVDEVMTRNVLTCMEADTIDELMARMTAERIRHFPVVENGTLVGIISIGDVVKHRVAEVELEASAMRDYIAAG